MSDLYGIFATDTQGGPDVSGKRPRDGSPCRLEEVVGAFEDLLLLPDHGAVYTGLAAVVANYADGDVVWPLLVGPPGCGKSEIITALTSAPDVWALSSLTPQTLLSGFEKTGAPASLLLQIGEFGILAFKDLTTVLTMHRQARGQIIGQLREVADGKTTKSFGNGVRRDWEGKLGFVAGVTPIIDEQHSFLAIMGERFVLYRMPEASRKDIARRSMARRGHEPELRKRIKATVGGFLEQFRDCGRLELPDSFNEPLIVLADIVTRARSGVARDYNANLLYIPEPEAPTRLTKHLAQLGAAMLAIGVDKRETWRLVRKAGWDSVPAVRCAVLDCLSRHDEPIPLATIQEQTGLPDRTAARVAEDIAVLRLARRFKDGGRWYFEQSAIAHEYWDSEALPKTSEGAQSEQIPLSGDPGDPPPTFLANVPIEPEEEDVDGVFDDNCNGQPPFHDEVEETEVERLAEAARNALKETAVTAAPDDGLVPSAEWLARDGEWRSYASDPPSFEGEVAEVRGVVPAAPGRSGGSSR